MPGEVLTGEVGAMPQLKVKCQFIHYDKEKQSPTGQGGTLLPDTGWEESWLKVRQGDSRSRRCVYTRA